jgi:hypothetical protein
VPRVAEEVKVAEKEEEEKDSSEASSEEEIDLDNLPNDRHERFRLLQIDEALIDSGDEPLILTIEASVIEELRSKQERRH